jgi:hypothetical protein
MEYTMVFFEVAALAGAAWLTLWLIRRANDAGGNSPGRLFAHLCRAHGLDWSDRRLLLRLARSRGLADPARVFVEPRFLQATSVDSAPAARLTELRRRLFDA